MSYVSKDREFGRLEMVAKPRGSEWRIERLHLANADGTVAADSAWREAQGAASEFDVALDVRDAAGFLARLGFPAAVQGAPTASTVSWRRAGAPNAFDFPTLAGTFRVDVGAGRFTKLEPGIGKLLGVLSLQALPRPDHPRLPRRVQRGLRLRPDQRHRARRARHPHHRQPAAGRAGGGG